ncbi:cyclase family protein [Sphingomonas sp.]|uniref:cyclase family protein n=1 Tax=Sphingomonas sp. TaxID=28214 RepID=UPI002DD68DDE|nr:cyclase family protein [Sphingomonas sp.]
MVTTLLTQLANAIAGNAITVVDLTQPLSEDTPLLVLPEPFGQTAAFSRQEISRYDDRGVAWYWNNFTVGEHTGTHFDAPIHWVTGRDLPDNTVDTIDPANFIAPAVVLDCSAQCAENPDFVLTRETIQAWETVHGRIEPGNWIFFRTDWSKRVGDAYTNRRDDGAHTPGPDPEACRFLIEDRDAHGFGVETIGTDAGQAHLMDPAYPAHTLFHGAGRYGLQCLQNLDKLPPKGALIVSAPLKIAGGSGSPLRVLALVEG